MPRTSPLISFGLYALAIKQDSSFAFDDDLQTFSKLNDLKTGNVASRPYITYEPDFWLLDGGYKFKPTNDTAVHVGLMSLGLSGVDGSFSSPPTLTVTFSEIHTTDGLIIKGLQYSEDYASDITITFYDATDTVIRTDNYIPDSWEFSTEQAVTDFKKIEIVFNATNKPYRYLRLTGIDFGQLTYFTSADIKSATVVEQVNPISIELPVNTFEVSLFSSDATFSIINPDGEYASLQNKQPLDVYEIVDNEQVYIGQFYLDKWSNPSNTEVTFECIDAIGVLETVPYYGGIWTTAVNVEDLLETIMGAINTPYDLDAELYGTQIKGWIPVTNYREALQQIAFACGAYVTCSRAGLVQIYKTTLASELSSYDETILKSQKSMSQSLTLKTLVTGVEVTTHNYIENTDTVQLYNGTLAAGTHTIIFNAPMHDLSISGGTITTSGANYAIVSVASPGTVSLTGEGYIDTTQVYGVYNTTLDSTVKTNVLTISDATLVNASNVEEITQRVYDYYQMRYLQKVKLYAPSAAPSDSVLIDTLYNQQIGGVVEKMTLNLTGGFTAQTEIVGGVV